MAREPGDPDQDWECEVCGATHPGSLVAGLRREVEDMLEMTGQADHGGLEWLVTMYQGCLHPRHALLLTIKRYLINIYGRSPDASQPEHLERKIEYCGQILEACEVVMPGKARYKGEMKVNQLRLLCKARNRTHPLLIGSCIKTTKTRLDDRGVF